MTTNQVTGELAHEIQQLAADAMNGVNGSNISSTTVNVLLQAIVDRAGAIYMAHTAQPGQVS